MAVVAKRYPQEFSELNWSQFKKAMTHPLYDRANFPGLDENIWLMNCLTVRNFAAQWQNIKNKLTVADLTKASVAGPHKGISFLWFISLLSYNKYIPEADLFELLVKFKDELSLQDLLVKPDACFSYPGFIAPNALRLLILAYGQNAKMQKLLMEIAEKSNDFSCEDVKGVLNACMPVIHHFNCGQPLKHYRDPKDFEVPYLTPDKLGDAATRRDIVCSALKLGFNGQRYPVSDLSKHKTDGDNSNKAPKLK